MFRTRMMLAATLVVGLAAVSCATNNDEEIAALNERLDALEKQVQSIQSSGGFNAANEQEATRALTTISGLVAQGKIDEAKAQLREASTKYASTKAGRSFQRLTQELAVVGKGRPSDWGIEKWFQGENAVDLKTDGTMVVVFWETWCPHCRREVPKLQAMYEKFEGQGLQMVGLTRINKSATEEAVQDIIAQNKVRYPIAKENGAAAKHFGVSGIPAAAVLDEGKVVWRGHPARITEQMLQDWLAS